MRQLKAYGLSVFYCLTLACVGVYSGGYVSDVSAADYADIGQAPAGSYALDTSHGYITFSYSHQGYSRPWLRFKNIQASLQLDPQELARSELTVSIDAASIDSGVDLFDEHLRGKNFFQVDQFLYITFAATEIVTDPKSPTDFLITGDLTIKGITKAVTLKALFNKGGLHFKTKQPVVGFSATGLIKRSDWDLGYAVPMVGDEVNLVIEVEFHKE